MAETFELISIISFIVGIVFAVIALITWFVFKIPSVISDLSGRTAKKSIENMRNYNENSGGNSYKNVHPSNNRDRLTETMEQDNKQQNSKETHYETGLLNENKAGQYETEETGILLDEEETVMLVDDEVAELETELLMNDESTGSLIDENEEDGLEGKNIELNMLDEVIYVHTDEVI